MRKRESLCLAFALALLLVTGCGKTGSRESPASASAPSPAVTEVPAGQLPVPETPAPTAAPTPETPVESALSEAERAYADTLTAQLLADGYELVAPEQYGERTRQALLCPDAVPESYRALPGIFFKPNPRVSSQTMITRIWFDAGNGEYLQFTQEDSELWVDDSFRYEERADGAEGGIRYRGTYKTRAHDLVVTGALYLTEDKGEDYCRPILTAIHFEKAPTS